MERKFELVTEYQHLGEDFIPQRSTIDSAGYDFRCAKDTLVPSLFRMILEVTLDKHIQLDLARHFEVKDDEYLGMDLEDSKKLLKKYGIRPTLVPTGIKASIPKGEYLALKPRSSLPLNTLLIMANSEGVIDGDYYNNPSNEGHIYVQLINLSPFDIVVHEGDKIAQGIYISYGTVVNDHETEKTNRAGGFGSTGN